MDPAEAIASVPAQLVTDSTFVESVSPLSALALAADRPRGLWAREGEWVAHAGTLDVLRADSGEDRFRAIREAASRFRPDPREPGVPLRFFGGFSFHALHDATDHWLHFPQALFHLPEFELISRDGGALLRAWAVREEDESEDAARERVRQSLEKGRLRLRELPDRLEDPAPVPCARVATDPGVWRSEVEEALEAIHGGVVSKVVLARTLDVIGESPLDALRVLDFMWRENRGAHVFLFEPSPGHLIVGAAPETVATVDGGAFHATAVAGSVARGETDAEQRALAARLLGSAKDRIEQRIALDDMVERLRPLAESVRSAAEPHVLTLARIQHLETHIRARLREGIDVLTALETLHPTPAVCGLPRDAALRFLDREEPFERGWYSGPVGWFDAAGNGVFAPALRCAVAHGNEWRLFAGAGIVSASDPALEWEETGIKFEPVLRALSASGAR